MHSFFKLFMCKVLRLRIFFCKIMIYFFIFFGLGPKFETDQTSQPPALPSPPNLARKDKKWTKVGLKWKCKVDTCIVAYCAKWLLTKHLKEVHGLVVENIKPKRLSTFEGSLQHQDHAKMNARILGNAMVVQK